MTFAIVCVCSCHTYTRAAHMHTQTGICKCVWLPEIENRRRNEVIYCLKIEEKRLPETHQSDDDHIDVNNNKNMKEKSTKNNKNSLDTRTYSLTHISHDKIA